MAKAQISFPDGTTVKLEGTPDEISAVVDRGRKTQETGRHSRRAKVKARSRPPQLVDLIANLIDGGFFKKPKDGGREDGAGGDGSPLPCDDSFRCNAPPSAEAKSSAAEARQTVGVHGVRPR